ncbi:MAG: recombinase [Clostridiales bacterium GWF2_38_85]|nr:MAG: recombinase [Clostridiales bacterium GWF2_38_85]HBL84281.1 recombinase family protein [Clostridiales bacterium]
MQYCIYLRKSRADIDAEARGEGETLARHEKCLIELAKKLNLIITAIYREVVSGETISARPVMQQLLSEVEQGAWAGVLVMEVERLARGDTIDQGIVAQAFKYSDTKIITPSKTYDPNNEYDEEYFEFGLFMSRREYKTINRRLQRGRMASVKEGKFLGSVAPYGYEKVKITNNKGYTLKIMPEQADVIRFIFELFTKGEQRPDGSLKRLGASLICRRLNDLKIPPQKRDYWVNSSILDILINPVYTGKIRWNWRPVQKKVVNGQVKKVRPRADESECILIDGLHDAIIDDKTWETAQQLIQEVKQSPIPNKYNIMNPLAGIVKCALCGRNMIRRPHPNNKPATLMCPATACSNISAQLDAIEESLLVALKAWVTEYKLKWNDKEQQLENNQDKFSHDAIIKLEKELENLKIQATKIYDFLEQGVYTVDVFQQRMKEVNSKIEETQNSIAKIKNELSHFEQRREAQISIIPKIENLLNVYRETDDNKYKNDLLKEVLSMALYKKTVNGHYKNADPNDFSLILYPRLPK